VRDSTVKKQGRPAKELNTIALVYSGLVLQRFCTAVSKTLSSRLRNMVCGNSIDFTLRISWVCCLDRTILGDGMTHEINELAIRKSLLWTPEKDLKGIHVLGLLDE
jgi:hypothetical protein